MLNPMRDKSLEARTGEGEGTTPVSTEGESSCELSWKVKVEP